MSVGRAPIERRAFCRVRPASRRLSDSAHELRRQRLTGIAMMCGAVAFFAALDAIAKYLGRHMDPLQVTGMRFISGFLIALIIFNPLTRPGLLRTYRPGLQFLRGLFFVSTTIFNFLAFRYLQLDEALAIMFATPFLVAIAAGPVLGEWVGWRRWTAIAVGFLGVLVVIRPGIGGGMQWAALLSVASAIFYASYGIATRMVSRSDSSETTLFYGNLVGVGVMLPVLPFVWTAPSWTDLVMLMAVGALGSAGHYLLIAAHRRAPASVLSPFIYTQLLWASTLGFLVFGDIPTQWTLGGGAIVVASGLYLIHRERKVTGRVVAPVEPN
jgi:drug/metabolite transporter (DMT)-like permease